MHLAMLVLKPDRCRVQCLSQVNLLKWLTLWNCWLAGWQPPSIVTDDVCAACDFNRPGKTCLRQMEWVWRGETYSAKRRSTPSLAFHFPWVTGFGSHTLVIWLKENWCPKGFQNLCMISVALIRGSGSDDSEYNHLKNQIESEQFHPSSEGGLPRFFRDLPKDEQQAKLKDRLKKYCQKVFFFHLSSLCNSLPPSEVGLTHRFKFCLYRFVTALHCHVIFKSLLWMFLCECFHNYGFHSEDWVKWQQVYKRVLDKPITDIRTASICMRENPFYVDTVRRWVIGFFPASFYLS
jgi:hypothetical protein